MSPENESLFDGYHKTDSALRDNDHQQDHEHDALTPLAPTSNTTDRPFTRNLKPDLSGSSLGATIPRTGSPTKSVIRSGTEQDDAVRFEQFSTHRPKFAEHYKDLGTAVTRYCQHWSRYAYELKAYVPYEVLTIHRNALDSAEKKINEIDRVIFDRLGRMKESLRKMGFDEEDICDEFDEAKASASTISVTTMSSEWHDFGPGGRTPDAEQREQATEKWLNERREYDKDAGTSGNYSAPGPDTVPVTMLGGLLEGDDEAIPYPPEITADLDRTMLDTEPASQNEEDPNMEEPRDASQKRPLPDLGGSGQSATQPRLIKASAKTTRKGRPKRLKATSKTFPSDPESEQQTRPDKRPKP